MLLEVVMTWHRNVTGLRGVIVNGRALNLRWVPGPSRLRKGVSALKIGGCEPCSAAGWDRARFLLRLHLEGRMGLESSSRIPNLWRNVVKCQVRAFH